MTRDRLKPPIQSAGLHRRTRRFPRKAVNLDAELSPVNIKLNVPQNISTIHGSVRNLSSGGLFVELPMLYRVGTRFQVRLPIAESVRTFYAIVWRVDLTHADEKPSVFGHGMKITTASEETLHAIVNYIATGPFLPETP